MKHGSLFSGIGGFDLAAEWMGWENQFHCEWNPFSRQVLNYHFPNTVSYEDITKTDFSLWRGKIDILTGGFPCQPYSLAGKRKGKEDELHLWPEMLRAIREVQPRWVVGENVFGLVNWNGGLVFHEVQADLEAEGYEVFPYVLPACAINAPHRRDRVWFVAFKNTMRIGRTCGKVEQEGTEIRKQRNARSGNSYGICGEEMAGHTPNPTSEGGRGQLLEQQRQGELGGLYSRARIDDFQNFPTQSPICGGDDGLPAKLDGITFPKWRAESIKAYGNAIVPQVALQIFRAIQVFENDRISPLAHIPLHGEKPCG